MTLTPGPSDFPLPSSVTEVGGTIMRRDPHGRVPVPLTHGAFKLPGSSPRWNDLGGGEGTFHFCVEFIQEVFSTAGSIDTDQAVPFMMAIDTRWREIGVLVQVAQALSLVRIGIYSNINNREGNDSRLQDFYPDALLLDSGDVDTSATGFITNPIDFTFPRTDIFWCVYNSNNVTMRTLFPFANNISKIVTGIGTNGLNAAHFSAARVFGPPPSTFPSGATISTSAPHGCVYRLGAAV